MGYSRLSTKSVRPHQSVDKDDFTFDLISYYQHVPERAEMSVVRSIIIGRYDRLCFCWAHRDEGDGKKQCR